MFRTRVTAQRRCGIPRYKATPARRKFTTRRPTAVYDAIAASGVPVTQVIEEAVPLAIGHGSPPAEAMPP
jgi:hypothetical protein